jgi:uncharacterized protein (DUF1015 family)
MTIARPFRAVRYDTTKVNLSQVIVPPYDVIAVDERDLFYDRDPHNAIRFELTRRVADEADTDYSEIAETLAAWRSSGILVQEDAPAYYVMRQRFSAPEGGVLERIGFFAELGLEDYSKGVVRPHERTLAGPKADRLKVLRASRANLSSVFLLYEDREQEMSSLLASAFETGLLGEAKDDAGVEYALASLQNEADIERLRGFMEARPTVIADGHHRYETALAYRDEQRGAASGPTADAPSESTLAYFANAYAPGSLLLPIHRVIRTQALDAPPAGDAWDRLPAGWSQKQINTGPSDPIASLLAEHLEPLAGKPAFAAQDAEGVLRIFWRDSDLGGKLMVRILEDEVLGGVFGLAPEAIREGAVSFPKSAERAASELRDGSGCLALYLNPLSPDDVFRVTGAGEVMPQKSTFFYPKVPTGLVFRDHRG